MKSVRDAKQIPQGQMLRMRPLRITKIASGTLHIGRSPLIPYGLIGHPIRIEWELPRDETGNS